MLGSLLDEFFYAIGVEDRSAGKGELAKKRDGLLGEIMGGITDFALGEVGTIIKKGIKEAGIGDILAEAVNPVTAQVAKAQLETLKAFQSFGDALAKSWSKADQAAFDYAKQVGMSEKAIEKFRDGIINMSGAVTEVGNLYGKTFEDLLKLQSKFSEELGRSVRFSTEQLKDVAAMSGIVGDDMAVKFAAQMETFGMSTSSAGEIVAKMYGDSVKKGITLQAYSKNVSENLHLAQQYTFKNGVQGLMSMAENAAKMKMDMQQVVSLGNKLAEGGVESAVNMGAELQVLGGAFAQFADPLGLLHDSLLDMEGLSDRLTSLVGEMGRFDKQQGKVVIDPFQQMQLRTAAKSMGLDYSKLIDSATQQAKRKEIESQMVGLSNIPDKYKEMIINTAQFDKNGNAGVTLANGSFKNISELTRSELIEIADLEKDLGTDVKEIKKFLIGAEDARKNQEAALENQRAVDNHKEAKVVKSVYQALGENQKALQDIVHWQKISAMYAQIQAMKQMGTQVLGVFKGIGKLLGFANGGMIKTHSEGDIITNGTPGKEYILNSAQHGEFIVNAKATKHHLGLLRAINGDKNGNLRFKKYEDGGLLNTLTTGNGIGAPMPMMGGMGIMGNMYQLQMYQQLNEGIKKMTTGSERYLQLQTKMDSHLNNIKSLKNQGTSLNNKLSRWQTLNNRAQIGSKQYYQSKFYIDKYTKELETINHNLSTTQKGYDKMVSMQDKVIKKEAKMRNIGRVGGSVMAGVGAFMSAKAQYEATGEAIMNKQKAQAGSIGAGIGAAAGTALGSFAGPIGMMIGGAIGQMAGQAIGEAVGSESDEKMWKMRGELAKDIDSAEGSNKFMRIKGDFSTKEQKVLASALNDGKLYEGEIKDEDLLTKLKETGNGQLIEKHARGGWIKGRTHSAGGELLGIWGGKIHEGEDSEAIIPADKAKKSTSLINALLDGRINDSTIKPIEPMGKQMKVNERYAQNQSPQTFKMEPININFNGSIKLETNDKSFDISEEIFKNPRLLNKITDLIVKQMNTDEHFAFNRKTFRKKYTTL